jgi:uncharacterized protein (TIGR03083 family)
METGEHLEGLREAMMAFVRHSLRAGLKAPVPTTPDWSVRRLVAHQGMVHRWATSLLAGGPNLSDEWQQEGIDSPDPLEWLRDGAIDLVTRIVSSPDDVVAPVFLANAGEPKPFWARRQCHETTIHAVDALAASLGRMPRSADAVWISEAVALDGIDELVRGWLPRPVSRLRAEEPQRIVVAPYGSERAWRIDVSTDQPVVALTEPDADGDVRLAGSAPALYLALWNRSDEVEPEGELAEWSEGRRIRW